MLFFRLRAALLGSHTCTADARRGVGVRRLVEGLGEFSSQIQILLGPHAHLLGGMPLPGCLLVLLQVGDERLLSPAFLGSGIA